jgi:acetyl/propionyl-CoA carboxylase alpha subunit
MLEIAAGGKVPIRQEDLNLRGHAIECRIIAEDPERNFTPSPGKINGLRPPAGFGVRYDDGTYEGYTVPVYYDPMISKLIAWGRGRTEAVARMARALDELRIDGLTTSVSFHRKVMDHPAFQRGELHTGFLEEHPELLKPADDPWLNEIAVVAAAVAHFRRLESLSARDGAGTDESGTGASRWRWFGRGGGWRS